MADEPRHEKTLRHLDAAKPYARDVLTAGLPAGAAAKIILPDAKGPIGKLFPAAALLSATALATTDRKLREQKKKMRMTKHADTADRVADHRALLSRLFPRASSTDTTDTSTLFDGEKAAQLCLQAKLASKEAAEAIHATSPEALAEWQASASPEAQDIYTPSLAKLLLPGVLGALGAGGVAAARGGSPLQAGMLGGALGLGSSMAYQNGRESGFEKQRARSLAGADPMTSSHAESGAVAPLLGGLVGAGLSARNHPSLGRALGGAAVGAAAGSALSPHRWGQASGIRAAHKQNDRELEEKGKARGGKNELDTLEEAMYRKEQEDKAPKEPKKEPKKEGAVTKEAISGMVAAKALSGRLGALNAAPSFAQTALKSRTIRQAGSIGSTLAGRADATGAAAMQPGSAGRIIQRGNVAAAAQRGSSAFNDVALRMEPHMRDPVMKAIDKGAEAPKEALMLGPGQVSMLTSGLKGVGSLARGLGRGAGAVPGAILGAAGGAAAGGPDHRVSGALVGGGLGALGGHFGGKALAAPLERSAARMHAPLEGAAAHGMGFDTALQRPLIQVPKSPSATPPAAPALAAPATAALGAAPKRVVPVKRAPKPAVQAPPSAGPIRMQKPEVYSLLNGEVPNAHLANPDHLVAAHGHLDSLEAAAKAKGDMGALDRISTQRARLHGEQAPAFAPSEQAWFHGASAPPNAMRTALQKLAVDSSHDEKAAIGQRPPNALLSLSAEESSAQGKDMVNTLSAHSHEMHDAVQKQLGSLLGHKGYGRTSALGRRRSEVDSEISRAFGR